MMSGTQQASLNVLLPLINKLLQTKQLRDVEKDNHVDLWQEHTYIDILTILMDV